MNIFNKQSPTIDNTNWRYCPDHKQYFIDDCVVCQLDAFYGTNKTIKSQGK